MQNNEKKGPRIFRMRLFPIVLGGLTGLCFLILGNFSFFRNLQVLSSFGELVLVVSIFLLFIFLFDAIREIYRTMAHRRLARREAAAADSSAKAEPARKSRLFGAKKDRAAKAEEIALTESGAAAEMDGERPPSFLKRLGGKFTKLFGKSRGGKSPDPEVQETVEEPEAQETVEGPEDTIAADVPVVLLDENDVVQIEKASASADPLAGNKRSESTFSFYLSIVYIAGLIAGGVWCVLRIISLTTLLLAGEPPAYVTASYSIVSALILVVFSSIVAIYLRMRSDNGTRPGDKTSHGLLTLLLFSSLVYAVIIAINLILGVNILIILPWLYCAVLVYLLVAVVINILVFLLKHDVLGTFDYIFLPAAFIPGYDSEDILDSDEVKSKFSLKSLWTIRYVVGILPGLVLLLGLVTFLSTTIYVIQPHQQAIICRFGASTRESVVGEGIHFKLPWPIDEAHIYDVQRINSMQIGYSATDTKDFIWGVAHDGGEHLLLLGNGTEVVAVNFKVNYKIDDLYTYFTAYAKPEEVLSAATYEAIMNRTVHTTLDVFLSIDRSSFSKSLADEITAFCREKDLGIIVTDVIIQGIHPPINVASVYQKVVTAAVDKNSTIVNARTTAESQLINAEQQYQEAINTATADHHTRVSSAQEEMAVYYAAMEAYDINPECFELTKYIETYETIIKGRKVYVFSPGTEDNISQFVIGKLTTITQNANSADTSQGTLPADVLDITQDAQQSAPETTPNQ